MIRFTILNTVAQGLKGFWGVFSNEVNNAQAKAAVQFLDWCNEGSPRESRTPPIKEGDLRHYSRAYVGEKEVSGGAGRYVGGTSKSVIADMLWVWEMPYAVEMHEHTGHWGERTLAQPDAGNKWAEKHLAADKAALVEIIAQSTRKGLRKKAVPDDFQLMRLS